MCQIDGKTQPWVQSWPPGPRPQKPKPSSPQVIKGRGRRQGRSLQNRRAVRLRTRQRRVRHPRKRGCQPHPCTQRYGLKRLKSLSEGSQVRGNCQMRSRPGSSVISEVKTHFFQAFCFCANAADTSPRTSRPRESLHVGPPGSILDHF